MNHYDEIDHDEIEDQARQYREEQLHELAGDIEEQLHRLDGEAATLEAEARALAAQRDDLSIRLDCILAELQEDRVR